MRALSAYAWPGNVRELRNVLELASILRAGRAVRASDLPPAVRDAAPDADGAPLPGETIEVRLDRPLSESVDAILRAAVRLEDGNRARAATRLRVGLRTVQRRVR
jgi:DNA-binding NtrC family response regulator